MSNITKFLHSRELGFRSNKWTPTNKVEDFYDEIASKSVVNKACSLSRRCRATFLVDFSPDRTKIASTHGDHSVRITDAATGKCTHVLEGHPRTPWCLAFHPSSNQIVASGCLHGEVRIWDLFGGGSEVWRLEDHTVIASLTFHPTDNVLVFAAGNKIYFWDWSKPEPFACCSTKHDYERVRWIKFHPHGHHLYTGITNNATLQQSSSSRVSYLSGSDTGQRSRTRALSNVYDNLVECFQTYQRGRVINLATAGSGPVANDSDLDAPQSPVHEEGLSFARQYARHMTETLNSGGASSSSVVDEPEPSTSSVPPALSEDLSWSPPPRIAPQEVEIELEESSMIPPQPRPVVIVPSSHSRASGPSHATRQGAGIIGSRGGRRGNIFQRQIYGQGGASGGTSSSERSAPSSGGGITLDHSDCDGHCDVCRNYNMRLLRRNNQSLLQQRQAELESRQRYCRNRLMALRRRHSNIPRFNERSSIHSDNSIPIRSTSSILHRLARSVQTTSSSSSQSNDSADVISYPGSSEHNASGFESSQANELPSNQGASAFSTSSLTVEHSSPGNQSQQGTNTVSTEGESATSDSALTENYANIHSNFVSITSRLEQEMNELDRRINDLRNSFQESIRQLQVDHGLGEEVSPRDRDVPLNQQVTRPVITVTGCRESHENEQNQQGNQQSRDRTHLLETALRTSVSSPRQSQPQPVVSSNQSSRTEAPSNTWQTLQRHHLHPHYSVSILDDTINRPQDAVQRAINHTIAGAFMGRGEAAVASNIVNQTYRIQYWDMEAEPVPDISDEKMNIIVPHCKLHNDASCDVSQDGTLFATFAPSHRGFPDDNILAVYSLRPGDLGDCLFTKSFGPNAISVSISPRNQHVLVGLAAKRLIWVFNTNQLVGQIFKLDTKKAGENSTKHVTDIIHPCDIDIRAHVSVNSARWLPTPGHGLVYGTNRGDLQICRPGCLRVTDDEEEAPRAGSAINRRNLMHMLGGMSRTPVTVNTIATQTPAVRRTMSTQTDQSDSNVKE